MIRIALRPAHFDLFHIATSTYCVGQGARLIAGVLADDRLMRHKGITPVIPLAERLEIVRNVQTPAQL